MHLDLLMAYVTRGLFALRKNGPDLFWILGLLLIAVGVGMIYLPAGVIAAGLGACFVGYAAGDSA